MSIITEAEVVAVRDALNKIDNAVLAVQDLADREDQQFPNRPRLKELRAVSRTLARCEQRLQELFS